MSEDGGGLTYYIIRSIFVYKIQFSVTVKSEVILIPDTKFIKRFDCLYEVIKTVGCEYLQSEQNKSQIRVSERLTSDLFDSLFTLIADGNGVIPTNKIKFILFVYSHYLNELYLNEMNSMISDLKNEKYKFWVVLIYWRKDPKLKEYSKEEQNDLILSVPENTGSFESLEWRLRIKSKQENQIIYSKSFKSNCYSKIKCQYNLNRMFTTEFEIQKDVMNKYETLFARIRKIKKYLADANNNIRALNLNIAELVNDRKN